MLDHQHQRHKLDIIAIGASAGGVEAICGLLKHLPANLPAVIGIVLHRPTESTSSSIRWPSIPAVGGKPAIPKLNHEAVPFGCCSFYSALTQINAE